MNLRSCLLRQVKRSPAAVRAPLRAAWHAAQRVRKLLFRKLERRVLGIYHFQEHAGYLGDMVDYLEILNVLRVQHRLAKIDLCYVDDPSNPNQPVSRVRIESSSNYKAMMVQLHALLPALGSVLQFDSDAAFETFFRSQYRRYVCWPRYSYFHSWPSRVDYSRLSERGYAYANNYAPLDNYFEHWGPLPKLTCPSQLLDWARNFVRSKVAPALPVALQIRFNADSPLRNTDVDAWIGFLRRMEQRDDVKFLILCRREEILPELRQLRNVIYSKDHASEVLEDIALLQVSHFSLFPDAGFVQFPWFCALPTIYFGKVKHEFIERRYRNESGQGLRFLSPWQRRIFGPYTQETLEREFRRLWDDLTAANWKNPYMEASA